MSFLTPNTNFYNNIYDKGKYLLAWRMSLAFIFFSLFLFGVALIKKTFFEVPWSIHLSLIVSILLLISLKNFDITGSKMEKVCELVNISLNKNCIPGDTSALKPNGIRIGTPCMTTRGMDKDGWNRLSCWLKECVDICIKRQNMLGRKLKNWSENIEKDLRIVKLRDEIINYAKTLKFYI